jgi:hypothetical protein
LALVREQYEGFGPTLAKEKLEELYIEYPYLHPDYETEQKNALSISFETIIAIL